MNKIAEALGLFASAIKSGEPWTDTCQQALDTARKELSALPPPSAEVAEMVGRLPRYDGNGGARLGESVITPCANGRYVALEHVQSLLERLAAQPAIAEGWRMVPQMPTGAMLVKASRACNITQAELRQVYEVMTAAAPPCPAGEGKPQNDLG